MTSNHLAFSGQGRNYDPNNTYIRVALSLIKISMSRQLLTEAIIVQLNLTCAMFYDPYEHKSVSTYQVAASLKDRQIS